MKHRPWTSGDGIAFIAEHNELYKDWLDACARIAELEAELADRREADWILAGDAERLALEPRPVKVRFDVTDEGMASVFNGAGLGGDGMHCLRVLRDYLASHAVIDVPADLPSDEVMAERLHQAYDATWTGTYSWENISKTQRTARIAQARAAKEMLAPWLRSRHIDAEELERLVSVYFNEFCASDGTFKSAVIAVLKALGFVVDAEV